MTVTPSVSSPESNETFATAPGVNAPADASLVTECAMGSSFCTTMVAPGATVRSCGM